MDYSALLMVAITLASAQLTVLCLARFRYRTKTILLILLTDLILQVALNALVMYLAGVEWMTSLYFLTVDMPAFVLFFLISKRRDLRDVFTIMIVLFLSFSISLPCMEIKLLFGDEYWWYDLTRAVIYAIILILLYKFVRYRYLKVQDEVTRGWGIFSILPMIGSLFLYYKYLIYLIDRDFSRVILDCIVISLIMAAVFFVFFYIFNQLHEKYLLQEQKRVLDIQNKAQLTQFEHDKEINEKMNRRWHDFRHNTQELIGLLEAGKTEEALSYLKEQNGSGDMMKEEYCLHPAVNSILSFWAQKSRKDGILVDVRADVPEQLGIDPMELSALFANAFENAYEGCLRITEQRRKYIKLNAHYNGKRLAIGFVNSCTPDVRFENGLPVSLKDGGGIGTRSILYTVKRYHGTAFFEAKEGAFTTRLILNI